jgi:Uma2 family endonuclease
VAEDFGKSIEQASVLRDDEDMQIALPDLNLPVTVILDREHRLTDEDYFAFCAANPELNVERTREGEIVIVPPAGGESDFRTLEAAGDLREWAKKDRRGKAFASSVQFLLPDGSGLSPDAAWVSNKRLAALTKVELRKFPRLVPEFVIEVMSPSDRLASAQKKMQLWAANGVDLGWLIDGDNRRVFVYRGASEPRVVTNAASIAGEGPVEGFVLPLGEIWAGL